MPCGYQDFLAFRSWSKFTEHTKVQLSLHKVQFIMKQKSNKLKYEFSAKPWQYSSPGGWYFVSLPAELSREIRGTLRSEEGGWGRLKATAKIGNSEWDTAIWYDTKAGTYLLPLKAAIRKKELLEAGINVTVVLWL